MMQASATSGLLEIPAMPILFQTKPSCCSCAKPQFLAGDALGDLHLEASLSFTVTPEAGLNLHYQHLTVRSVWNGERWNLQYQSTPGGEYQAFTDPFVFVPDSLDVVRDAQAAGTLSAVLMQGKTIDSSCLGFIIRAKWTLVTGVRLDMARKTCTPIMHSAVPSVGTMPFLAVLKALAATTAPPRPLRSSLAHSGSFTEEVKGAGKGAARLAALLDEYPGRR